jgi:hypothetical protein
MKSDEPEKRKQTTLKEKPSDNDRPGDFAKFVRIEGGMKTSRA